MSTRFVVSVIGGLVWEVVLAIAVLYLLPTIGIVIPLYGLVMLMVAFGAYSIITYRVGSRALRRKPVGGMSSMVGSQGKAVSILNPRGTVKIKGELWEAVSKTGRIDAGENVTVVGQNGLQLTVDRVKQP